MFNMKNKEELNIGADPAILELAHAAAMANVPHDDSENIERIGTAFQMRGNPMKRNFNIGASTVKETKKA